MWVHRLLCIFMSRCVGCCATACIRNAGYDVSPERSFARPGVRVAAGGGEALVPEGLLDQVGRDAAIEGVWGVGVPEPVGETSSLMPALRVALRTIRHSWLRLSGPSCASATPHRRARIFSHVPLTLTTEPSGFAAAPPTP